MIFNVMDFNSKFFKSIKTQSIETSFLQGKKGKINLIIKAEFMDESVQLIFEFLSENEAMEFCKELHFSNQNTSLSIKNKELFLYAHRDTFYTLKKYKLIK